MADFRKFINNSKSICVAIFTDPVVLMSGAFAGFLVTLAVARSGNMAATSNGERKIIPTEINNNPTDSLKTSLPKSQSDEYFISRYRKTKSDIMHGSMSGGRIRGA